MARKSQIAVVATVMALLAAAAAAYAWDASRADQIADGVRVGEVDVGGLDVDEARRLLRRELVMPLERPIEVVFEGRRFNLDPRELDLEVDIDGALGEAHAASREGGLPARVWRYTTGAEVERRIEPRLSYAEDALASFVDEVAASVDRAPRDATIDPTLASLHPVSARAGLSLRREQLRERLVAALLKPSGPRTVSATAKRIEPAVTTDELAAQYPTYITVDRASFTLRFFRDLKLAESYTISVGQQGYETDPGLYEVQSKQIDPAWYVPEADWAGDLAGQVIPGGDPRNPLAARWLGFNGSEGIHGTEDVASLGSAASHGCIRMAVPDVIELYDRVAVGTPVYIE